MKKIKILFLACSLMLGSTLFNNVNYSDNINNTIEMERKNLSLPTSISVSADKTALNYGESGSASCAVTSSKVYWIWGQFTDNSVYTWTSSNTSAIKLDSTNGQNVTFSAVGVGTSRLTCTCKNTKHTLTSYVDVTSKAVLTFKSSSIVMDPLVNNTYKAEITSKPASYDYNDGYHTFVSTDKSVATVSSDVTITAIGSGTCSVYLSDSRGENGFNSDLLSVTVKDYVPVSSIGISTPNGRNVLSLSGSVQLWFKAQIYPSNATNKNIMWSSSDSSILNICGYSENECGCESYNSGEVTLTAVSMDNKSIKASINLYIINGGFFEETEHTFSKCGEQYQLNILSNKFSKIYSDDNSVATVDENGLITAKWPGECNIIAQYNGYETNDYDASVKSVCKINVSGEEFTNTVFEDFFLENYGALFASHRYRTDECYNASLNGRYHFTGNYCGTYLKFELEQPLDYIKIKYSCDSTGYESYIDMHNVISVLNEYETVDQTFELENGTSGEIEFTDIAQGVHYLFIDNKTTIKDYLKLLNGEFYIAFGDYVDLNTRNLSDDFIETSPECTKIRWTSDYNIAHIYDFDNEFYQDVTDKKLKSGEDIFDTENKDNLKQYPYYSDYYINYDCESIKDIVKTLEYLIANNIDIVNELANDISNIEMKEKLVEILEKIVDKAFDELSDAVPEEAKKIVGIANKVVDLIFGYVQSVLEKQEQYLKYQQKAANTLTSMFFLIKNNLEGIVGADDNAHYSFIINYGFEIFKEDGSNVYAKQVILSMIEMNSNNKSNFTNCNKGSDEKPFYGKFEVLD